MDDAGYLTMSSKELNRLEVLRRVLERRLTQSQAAEPARPRDPSGRAAVPKASGRRPARIGVEETREAQQRIVAMLDKMMKKAEKQGGT